MRLSGNYEEKSMLKYTAIPAVFAMAAFFHPGLVAAAKSASETRTNMLATQPEPGDWAAMTLCRTNSVSDDPVADAGAHPAGTPFTVDYMTANGDFFSLKRLFACTSHIHRTRIS